MNSSLNGTRAFAREQIATDGTVKTLTSSKYNPAPANGYVPFKATNATVQVTGADVYYTIDGTAPSAAAGKVGYVGSTIQLDGYEAISKFKVTQVSGAGELDVDYFR